MPSARQAVPDSIPPVAPRADAPESIEVPAEPISPAEALESQEIYEDDSVIAPAPDASVFAPKARPVSEPRAKRPPYTQTLEFKQTVIPVMLTSGTIMLITSIVIFVSGPDSIFAALPTWLSVVLLLFGLILLGLAAMNMMQVSKQLDQTKGA